MCLNPMIANPTGNVNPDTGKRRYKFSGSLKKVLDECDERHLRLTGRYAPVVPVYAVGITDRDQYWTGSYVTDEPSVDFATGEYLGQVRRKDFVILPCGQCIECRCNYAKQWATRIMLESQYHDKSYFVTLTYDEEHVPISESEDGAPSLTLRPKDLQDFVKRLRDQQSYHQCNTIRFYAVGEYGSQFHRPHYHLIVFGLILDDIKEIGRNKHGTVLHDSDTIRRLWSRGRTEVDELTVESAAYCARYTTKKLGKTESGIYESLGLVPEFSRMSLKPAIGYQYFQEHMQEIYDFDKIYYSTGNGGRNVKPPRYYDAKYDDIYPEHMAEVKGNRRHVAEEQLKIKLGNYNGSYLELLSAQADDYIRRTKLLKRNLEL